MAWMGILTACVLLAAAIPAAAQPGQFEIDALRAQQEAATRRAIAQENELSALDARLRAEQALADLRLQRNPPPLPQSPYPTSPLAAQPGAAQTLPSIPDATLADSNRRVGEASQPRR